MFIMISSAEADEFNWDGWYASAELGYSELQGDWKNVKAYNPDGSTPMTPLSGQVAPSSNSMKARDIVGALSVGRNWLVAPKWVVGAEAKWLLSNQDKKIDDIPGLDSAGTSTAKIKVKDGLALRTKGGYLVTPETLVYGSTGIVYQRVKTIGSCGADNFVCNPGHQTSDSSSYWGWTLGGGVQHAFTDRLIGYADYTYTNFESNSFTALQFENGTSYGSKAKLDPDSHAITLGLAYKF